MRLKHLLLLFAVLAVCTGTSYASIGWAGGVGPCDGETLLDSQDIEVFVEIWKDGCTAGTGSCAGLAASLYYKKASEGSYTSVAMSYYDEIGNNDRYRGIIPSAATSAGDDEIFYVEVYDSTDATWYFGAKNTWTCPNGEKSPPFALHISPATSQDVSVTFRVDMSCADPSWYSSGVFLAGEFMSWWSPCNPAYQMTDPDGDFIFEIQYTFPAGSTPAKQYKFNKNAGSCDWENGGNRLFVIDDSSPVQVLPVDVWDRWDCCQPAGPAEITGSGVWCVTLCMCDEYLTIPLNTTFNPPIIPTINFTPGCMVTRVGCNEECAPGAGMPQWAVVQMQSGGWALQLCLPRVAGNRSGCFCMSIDNVLAVELAGFDAIPGDNSVNLNWATRSETDLASFEIIRDGAVVHSTPSLGNSASGHHYSWMDVSVQNGTSYRYELLGLDVNGNHTVLAVRNATPLGSASSVVEYELTANYPNPFNPSTTFGYSLKEAGLVNVAVFDITGRHVAHLVNEHQSAGVYAVSFNGVGLPSGIYYYRMQVNDFTATHKMVMMK